MDLQVYFVEKIKSIFTVILCFVIIILTILFGYEYKINHEIPVSLKEFKDGVQNHLVWDVKGQCFFVRPHTDVTTYLIRVVDCDKK